MIPYSDLLAFDSHSLQQWICPFLELHNHSRPSQDKSWALIANLIRPELNRSVAVIDDQNRARIHPLLMEICDTAYKSIIKEADKVLIYREVFNSIPRAVLECSVREQLLPENRFSLLQSRLHSLESEAQEKVFSLEQREQDCVSLRRQIDDIRSSLSWKITAPLRSLVSLFRRTFW